MDRADHEIFKCRHSRDRAAAILALVFSLLFSSACTSQNDAYQVIDEETVRSHIDEAITKGEFPPPAGASNASFSGAQLGYAGVHNDSGGYLVNSETTPAFVTQLSIRWLGSFLSDAGWNADDVGEKIFFGLNGLLKTTTDIQILDSLMIYSDDIETWTATTTLPKGAYTWSIARESILLNSKSGRIHLIFFENSPNNNIDRLDGSSYGPSFACKLKVGDDKQHIALKVGGNEVRMVFSGQ